MNRSQPPHNLAWDSVCLRSGRRGLRTRLGAAEYDQRLLPPVEQLISEQPRLHRHLAFPLGPRPLLQQPYGVFGAGGYRDTPAGSLSLDYHLAQPLAQSSVRSSGFAER